MNIFEAQKIADEQIAAVRASGESADWIEATIERIPEYALRCGLGPMLPAAGLARIICNIDPNFNLFRIHRFFG